MWIKQAHHGVYNEKHILTVPHPRRFLSLNPIQTPSPTHTPPSSLLLPPSSSSIRQANFLPLPPFPSPLHNLPKHPAPHIGPRNLIPERGHCLQSRTDPLNSARLTIRQQRRAQRNRGSEHRLGDRGGGGGGVRRRSKEHALHIALVVVGDGEDVVVEPAHGEGNIGRGAPCGESRRADTGDQWLVRSEGRVHGVGLGECGAQGGRAVAAD